MQPDVNCLFRALSYCLSKNQDRHQELRLTIVSFILQHWDRYGDYIMGDESHGVSIRSAEDYKLHMGSQVPQRWVFAVMGCLAVLNAYTMRICLSLAITEMVATTESSSNTTSSDESCPSTSDSTSSNSSTGGTYDWDEYTQGVILSSFYWGYIITQLPGGILADKFGGKYILGLGILSTSIFSILTPIIVETFDSTGLIVLRVLMGFCEGTTFPAISVLIAQWAPPLERSKITGVVMLGISLGTVIGNGASGVMIQHSSIGWPIVFYVYGTIGAVWFLAWVVLCYSHPDIHPFISEGERKYLHESNMKHTHKHTQPIPWKQMMTSFPFWALIIAKAGFSWGFHVMLNDLPKYMSEVLKYSIEANGYLSALPYIVLGLIGTAASWPADWLIKNKKLSRTNVRKICHTFASVFPAIFIIAASYAGCDRTMVVVLFTIGVGTMGPYYITVMINPNDLSPNHTGTLMAGVNGVGALAGILAPYMVGILTPNRTLMEWRLVFWITFGLLIGTAVVFHIWADGEVQYWNDMNSWRIQRNGVESKKQANEEVASSKVDEKS